MKPDWDQLAEKYADHELVTVADVDCTAGGESLCKKQGVSGYPTIKYYTVDKLGEGQDYQGGRTYDDFDKFTAETFKPPCDFKTLENCNDVQTEVIKELRDAPLEKIKKKIDEQKAIAAEHNKKFNDVLEDGKKQMKEMKKKEAGINIRLDICNRYVKALDATDEEDEKKDEKEEL